MTPPVSTLKSRPEFIEHLDKHYRGQTPYIPAAPTTTEEVCTMKWLLVVIVMNAPVKTDLVFGRLQ